MRPSFPAESFTARLRKRWVMAVFALPFAGVGIGFLVLGVIPSIWESRQMLSWHQGYAHLVEAGVQTNHSDDGTTYRAYASYTYEYNGREYRGDRVGISGSSDNIGDYQQSLGARLQRALREGEPVTVWINPEDPRQAILDRELRWGMMLFQMVFVLAFGGVGVGLLALTLLVPGKRIPDAALTNVDIERQPWLSQRDWASPIIYSDAKTSIWGIWFFAGLWNVIALPAGVFAVPEVIDGNYAAALAFIFPLIGAGLLVWAIRGTLRWLRFGKTPLHLDPYPGSIGGQVGGTIDVGLPYNGPDVFKVTLSCLYSYMSGSGDDRSRKERVIWQSEGFAHTRSWNSGTRLEVLFNVDNKLPPSDHQDSSSYHLWRLHVHCELQGADFDRNYEIPVFPTQEPAKFLRQLSTDHHRAADHRLREIEAVLNLQQIPGGVEIYYPAFKKPMGKLIGMVFGIFFFTAGMVAGAQGAPLIFPIAFGLIGGLLAVGTFYSLIVALNVTIDQQRLVTRKSLFGLPVGGNRIPRQNIRHLRIKKSYSQSQGGKHQQFFKLQAVTRDKKNIDIGFNLAGQNVAEQALESISLLTGLPTHRK